MADEARGVGSSLLGGLVQQLSEGLAAVGDLPEPVAPAHELRVSPVGEPIVHRPVLLDAGVAATASVSTAALAEADRILAAAGIQLEDVPAPAPLGAWLLDGPAGVIELGPASSVVIGRSSRGGADVVVADAAVSKVHCRVRVDGGRLLLDDLGSTNGTAVRRNGTEYEVKETVEVAVGDTIVVVDGVALVNVRRATAP